MTVRWGGIEQVKAAALKAWERGDVLRGLHSSRRCPEPGIVESGDSPDGSHAAFPLTVRLRTPTAADVKDNWAQVSAWARHTREALADVGSLSVEDKTLAAGSLGRQPVPARVTIPTAQSALGLLGSAQKREASVFSGAIEQASALPLALREPVVDVALSRPHMVIAAAHDWPALLAVLNWLNDQPLPDVHIRQVPVDGIHSKLIENNRALLTRLCDAALPPRCRRDGDSLEAKYGFARKPRRVELRGPGSLLGTPSAGDVAVTWPLAALAALDISAHGITELVVCENHLSFMTAPSEDGRLYIFGEGYGVADLLGGLPWIRSVAVRYWGDIDTHGLVILNRLRHVAPHTLAVLMDLGTLRRYLHRCVSEPVPASELPEQLTMLTPCERELYAILKSGELGPQLRLEQEFIRYDEVVDALRQT